jgi:hypothetical protein
MERRRLLALLGGSASLGIAGCLGGGDNDGDDNESTENGGDNGGAENGSDNGGDGGEANIEVSITSAPSEIQAGGSTTVEWAVENTGNSEGSETVVFSVGGEQEASEEVTVGAGETATGEFTLDVSAAVSGDLTLSVAAGDAEATAPVTVPEEAFFAVDIPGTSPVRVEAGSEATIEWAVENTGDLEGSQTVVFTVDGSQEGSQEVTLGGGETAEGEFSYDTEAEQEAQIAAAVASDDDEATVNIAFGVDVVSNFTASAESARAAIDNDPAQYSDPGPELYQEIDTGEPLVEVSGEVFNDGGWESTEFNVPDLIDILLAADIGEVLAGLIEDFDIQADLVEAFTVEELFTEIAEIIYGFDFTEEQSQAAADLVQILLEELEVDLPTSLAAGVLQGTLKNPEYDEGGDDTPVETIATGIQNLLGFVADGSFESVEDVLTVLTSFIDGIPDGEFDQILPFLAETIAGLDFQSLLGDFSVEAEPDPVAGTMDPSGGQELLLTVPLETVTLVPDLGEEFSDPPAVDLDLGLELTTGASGNLDGEFTPDAEADTATATVVDNEFTADLTEFDLVGLAEGVNFADLLAELLSILDIDIRTLIPETFDRYDSFEEHVTALDPLALIQDGDPLGIVARLIEDESGRHAAVADLALEFDDLGAVLDSG